MRRVYIIPKTMKVEDALPEANALGIGEIVHGIPPRVQRESNIKEEDLPIVYEEPEIPDEIPINYAQEIEELKERLAQLEVRRVQ